MLNKCTVVEENLKFGKYFNSFVKVFNCPPKSLIACLALPRSIYGVKLLVSNSIYLLKILILHSIYLSGKENCIE